MNKALYARAQELGVEFLMETPAKKIVMEDGKIVAFDTHENLLTTSDIYREIYETQTSGSGDFDETNSDKDIVAWNVDKYKKNKPGMPPFPMPPMSDRKSRKHKEVKMP